MKELYELNLSKIKECKVYDDITQEFLSNKNITIKDEYWQSIYCESIQLTKEPIASGYNHIIVIECNKEYFDNYRHEINKYAKMLNTLDNMYNSRTNIFDIKIR